MWFNSHHPVAYSKQTKKSVESESLTSASRSLSLLKLTGKDDDPNSERSCFLQLWEDSPKDALSMFESGLSPSIRGLAWQLISRSIELLDDNQGVYEYLTESESSHIQNIRMDTERTAPFVPDFTEELQKQMNNVLNAYANKDDVIGYAQGMNYVVAMLMQTGMPEENMFWLLMRIMKGYSLERIFPSSYSVIADCFVRYEKLLQLYTPNVYRHMTRKLGVSAPMYAQQWFQTIFSYTQRFDLALRVLDLMMVRKIEALFCVSIAIIVLSKERILGFTEFSEAIQYLRVLDPELLPTDEIIKTAVSYPNVLRQLAVIESNPQNMPSDNCRIM